MGDDLEIGKTREAGGDVFGEAVGERIEIGVAAAGAEGEDGDPEAFGRSSFLLTECVVVLRWLVIRAG